MVTQVKPGSGRNRSGGARGAAARGSRECGSWFSAWSTFQDKGSSLFLSKTVTSSEDESTLVGPFQSKFVIQLQDIISSFVDIQQEIESLCDTLKSELFPLLQLSHSASITVVEEFSSEDAAEFEESS
jgi:hypothetical protein